MSETTRPDWASGPEWEGWRYHFEYETHSMCRTVSEEGPTMVIYGDGALSINSDDGSEICVDCKSPSHALTAANALAEAAGGWA